MANKGMEAYFFLQNEILWRGFQSNRPFLLKTPDKDSKQKEGYASVSVRDVYQIGRSAKRLDAFRKTKGHKKKIDHQ